MELLVRKTLLLVASVLFCGKACEGNGVKMTSIEVEHKIAGDLGLNATSEEWTIQDFPRDAEAEVMPFNIYLKPLTIVGFQETQNFITYAYRVDFEMKHPTLRWRPDKYGRGAVTKLVLNTDNVKWPQLGIHNSFDSTIFTVSDTRLYYNGVVQFFIHRKESTSCIMDHKYWPYDTQFCNYYVHINYDKMDWPVSQFSQHHPPCFELENSQNNEWEVIAANTTYLPPDQNAMTGQRIRYNLVFRRKSVFVVLTIYLPAIMLQFTSACILLIPADSGESLSVSFTILLSYFILFNSVVAVMPASSATKMPLFFTYLSTGFVITCLAVLFISIMIKLRKNHPKKFSERPKIQIETIGFCVFILIQGVCAAIFLRIIIHDAPSYNAPFDVAGGEFKGHYLAKAKISTRQDCANSVPTYYPNQITNDSSWSEVAMNQVVANGGEAGEKHIGKTTKAPVVGGVVTPPTTGSAIGGIAENIGGVVDSAVITELADTLSRPGDGVVNTVINATDTGPGGRG